eukprot:8719285-Ditylum_brightwellii.AAC.1
MYSIEYLPISANYMVCKVSGKVVCYNDDVLHMDCIIKEGCRACTKYECEDCKADTESPEHFEELHENDPDVYKDEYGRRRYCVYHALNVSCCLGCRGRICNYCGQQCEDCNGQAFLSIAMNTSVANVFIATHKFVDVENLAMIWMGEAQMPATMILMDCTRADSKGKQWVSTSAQTLGIGAAS